MDTIAWHPRVAARLRAAALLVLAAVGSQAQVARISHGAQAMEALGQLEGCWITAGARGLQAVSPGGQAVPVPDLPQPGPGQRCTAVAAMPPGQGPCPGSAPRLVAAMAGGGSARIVALGLDGARWEWPLDGRSAVRDLALDRDGATYAVFEDDRDVLRIDLAGNRILHARVPEGPTGAPASRAPDLPAGLLAMVRDPGTGNLYVGDRFGIHRVAPDGAVLPLLAADAPEHRPPGAPEGPIPPLTPCHLALNGRVLLIGDPYRGERFALHLDSGKLGAIPSAAGPLSVSPGGLCLQAGPDGLLTLAPAALGGGVAPAEPPSVGPPAPASPWSIDLPPPARSGAPGPGGRSARRLNLERARAIQDLTRNYKRDLRRQRRLAAEREARGRRPAAGAPVPPRRLGPSVREAALLGLCATALLDPPMRGALAQGLVTMPDLALSSALSFPSGFSSFSTDLAGEVSASSQLLAGFDQLESACASPITFLLGLQPCGPGYRAGVVAQLQDLDAQATSLLAVQTSGPGTCRPGETVAQAEARISLEQGRQSARFSLFAAQATALCTQMERDAFAVVGVGFGLTGGEALATPFRSNASLPLTVPALVLGEVGNALILAGFSAAGGGDHYCALGFDAQAAQFGYEAWAEGRKPALAATCAGAAGNGTLDGSGAVPGVSGAPPAILIPSPLPALADALDKQTQACPRASLSGLTLRACTPLARQGLVRRNATLNRVYDQVGTSLADGPSGRNRAILLLNQFAATTDAVAMEVFALGDGFFSAAEVVDLEEIPVSETGNVEADAASLAGVGFLFGVANLVWSSGYDLQRIAALASGQAAVLTLEGNTVRLAMLDQQEALVPGETASSSTGSPASMDPARAGGSGNATTGPSIPGRSTAGGDDGPAPSAGYRVRPFLFGWLAPDHP